MAAPAAAAALAVMVVLVVALVARAASAATAAIAALPLHNKQRHRRWRAQPSPLRVCLPKHQPNRVA